MCVRPAADRTPSPSRTAQASRPSRAPFSLALPLIRERARSAGKQGPSRSLARSLHASTTSLADTGHLTGHLLTRLSLSFHPPFEGRACQGRSSENRLVAKRRCHLLVRFGARGGNLCGNLARVAAPAATEFSRETRQRQRRSDRRARNDEREDEHGVNTSEDV